MPSDRADRVSQIFYRALDLPASDRTGFVREQCRDDPKLQDSILRLLSQEAKLGDFLAGPPFQTGSARFNPGESIGGRFRIESSVGQGGMGEVYRAEDSQLGETVALKTLHPRLRGEASFEARFREEIRLARKIAHPNVCRIFDLFVENRGAEEILYFTMEFLEGETLGQRISRGAMAPAQALDTLRQIAAGLEAAHRLGIVHRDLKPANILLARAADGSERAVITDFGLAGAAQRAGTSRETGAGPLIGTLDYMAPEQFLQSEVTPAADLWALAAMFHLMLTGALPYPEEDPIRSAIRRLHQPIQPDFSGRGVPVRWREVMARALSISPTDRYASAEEFIRALGASAPEGRLIFSSPFSRRGALLYGALSVVAGVGVFLRLRKWHGTTAEKPILMMTHLTNSAEFQSQGGAPARATEILLTGQLQQSRQLRLVSESAVQAAWSRIAGGPKPLPQTLEAGMARNLALRCGAGLVLFGNLSRVAGEPVLQLKIEQIGNDPATPVRSWPHEFTVRGESDLPSAAYESAAWIRSVAGEAEAEIRSRSRRPEDLTTPSWQALLEFTRANDAWHDGQSEAALLHLKTALDLDPGFARASARMADILVALGRRDEGLSYYSAAAEGIRQRNLTDRESLTISGLFAQDTGQLERAEQIFSRYAIEYPEDGLPLFYQAAAVDRLGRLDRALELANQALTRDPQSYSFIMQRARLLLDNGQIEEAAGLCERAAQIKAGDWSDLLRSGLAMARLDPAGVWAAIERIRATGSLQFQSQAISLQACFRAEQGRWPEAERMLNEGLAFDGRTGLPEQQRFNKRRVLAEVLLKQNRAREAGEIAAAMLEGKPGYETTMSAGCLLARSGRMAEAQRCLIPDLPAWPIYEHWRQRLQGEILLAKGDAAGALKTMLGAPPPKLKNQWPEYLVRAALAAGDRSAAARYVTALFRNPGGYWIQADSTGPGFISWAAGLAARLDLPEPEAARGRSLQKGLTNL